jgi:hypothetical protein
MLIAALLIFILMIAQPTSAQSQTTGDREELRSRFFRFRQMRNEGGKNMSFFERLQKFREFRSKQKNPATCPSGAPSFRDGSWERSFHRLYI